MTADRGAHSAASTRERIIAAAERLFDEVGIDKVNVADVADNAGVHRVTVYRHFADRGAVLDEVLLRRAKPILERAAARLAKAERFPDDLAYVMVAAVDEARQLPGVLQALSLVHDGDSITSRMMADRFANRAAEVTRPYLLEAQKKAVMRPELSVDETVRWLLQVCAGWLLLATDESPARLLHVCNTYVMPALVPG